MLSIDNNGTITVSRGEAFELPLFINAGTRFNPIRYTLGDDDAVYVGVMEPNVEFENAIIRKSYTHINTNNNGDVIVDFDSKDTEHLVPGTYYYEIRINLVKRKTLTELIIRDDVKVLVEKTKFIII